MEPFKTSTNYVNDYFAPCPHTERGYSTNLPTSSDGQLIAYCVGNIVVVRHIENLTEAKIFSGHRYKTCAVGFSPNGEYIAGGDIEGNIRVWHFDNPTKIKKEMNNVLGGKINGIGFSGDSAKLIVYGEGKSTFVKCINLESGNTIGEFSGHSKFVLTGDVLRSMPSRLITAGEDLGVNLYDENQYKLTNMSKHHTNFVTGLRFSPDEKLFVSVGYDKKIFVYNANDGSLLGQMDEAQKHSMAIMAVCWINNEQIATTSLDRTVKIWDVNTKECKFTLYPKEKESLDIPYSGCAVSSNGKKLINLTLNGKLNIWEVVSLNEGKLPDLVIEGHQSFVTSLCKRGEFIFSGDSNGKILYWNKEKKELLINEVL